MLVDALPADLQGGSEHGVVDGPGLGGDNDRAYASVFVHALVDLLGQRPQFTFQRFPLGLLRQPNRKKQAWQDLLMLKAWLRRHSEGGKT